MTHGLSWVCIYVYLSSCAPLCVPFIFPYHFVCFASPCCPVSPSCLTLSLFLLPSSSFPFSHLIFMHE